ncbi:MAG TPA: hypothetical protein VMW17_02460 [Candidatus Binatia bacterium]|nr:hypothetical protein [Candidatus Binatia bacterium]
MALETDPRTTALAAVVRSTEQRALLTWLLESLNALEQIDFGERQPVGVTAPIPPNE